MDLTLLKPTVPDSYRTPFQTTIDLKKRGLTVYLAAVKPDVLVVLKAHGLLDSFSKVP